MNTFEKQRKAYLAHAGVAKQRGIPFLLTFEEWLGIWLDSGKWLERGWNKGQYVMARIGDKGAYEIGNVYICLSEENRADRNRNYKLYGDSNPASGKDYWADMTDADRNKRSNQVSEKLLGIPKSNDMRKALAAKATGRKRVYRNDKLTWAYPGDIDFPQ